MAQIPTVDKRVIQTNTGDAGGNLKMSYALDLAANRGKIHASQNLVKAIDENDDSNLSSTIVAIKKYDGIYYALSSELWKGTSVDSWSQVPLMPTVGASVSDMEVFDNLLLFVDGTDIVSWDGTTRDENWWTSTRGQSNLTTGERVLLRRGPDNRLYISDGAVKVISADTDNEERVSGAGTLDFSATEYKIRAMEANSSRLFIGMENTAGGNAVIAEWDMGASTISANFLHPVGAKAVRCIFIWDDVPYAVLSDGRILYHNGSSFVDHPNFQFPTVNTNTLLADDFIHPNGWAIIDNMPHLLVKSDIEATGNGQYVDENAGLPEMPAGVWCCDPEVGLYHRFAVGAGETSDYGQPVVQDVGALTAIEDASSKFLASIDYYDSSSSGSSGSITNILYHDRSSNAEVRALMMSVPMDVEEVPQMIEAMHKKLTSGDELRFYFRQHNQDPIRLDGTWGSTTDFHTTEDASNVAIGNVGFVKTRSGAGALNRVSAISTSANTYVITFDEANSRVTEESESVIDFYNFKFAGKITGTGKDYEEFTLPTTEKSRQVELLVELRQSAGSVVELNNVKIV